MTPRQKKFCEYYIQSGNAAEAARKAGYSKKTAEAIGCEADRPMYKSKRWIEVAGRAMR